jgi:hypothetical protein
MRRLIVVATMMIVASAAAQAGQPRSLSPAGSDKSVQETKAAEPVRAAEKQRTPLPPKAADASGAIGATENSSVNETPKYTERPPGVDMSTRSRMKAAAMRQRRAQPHMTGMQPRMAGMEMRRPHPRHWSAARIVATLHRYGIYW